MAGASEYNPTTDELQETQENKQSSIYLMACYTTIPTAGSAAFGIEAHYTADKIYILGKTIELQDD
eukprot:1021197-Amphidinium_carterae.1